MMAKTAKSSIFRPGDEPTITVDTEANHKTMPDFPSVCSFWPFCILNNDRDQTKSVDCSIPTSLKPV